MSKKTLYERLGGYDAITAVVNDLLPRVQADPQLARFWQHRSEDGLKREKQLLIDFLGQAPPRQDGIYRSNFWRSKNITDEGRTKKPYLVAATFSRPTH